MNGIIKRWFIKMNAEQLINECDTQKFNPKQFRNEINISWLINDVKKQYEEQKWNVNIGKNAKIMKKMDILAITNLMQMDIVVKEGSLNERKNNKNLCKWKWNFV